MKLLHGTFEAIGVKGYYLSLGAIPLHIEFWGIGGATPDTIIWDQSMIHDILCCEGIMRPTGGGAVVDLAFGEGVAPYEGGDLLTSSNQTDLTYGGGIYVSRDDKDYREYTNAPAGIIGDASTVDIITWVLDTAGTPSGHFNGNVVGSFIGEGSLIRIQETASPRRMYEAAIHTSLSSTGSAADAVTLSRAVPNGRVTFIGGKYTFSPTPVGRVTSPGMVINETTTPFVDGEYVGFMAIMP